MFSVLKKKKNELSQDVFYLYFEESQNTAAYIHKQTFR